MEIVERAGQVSAFVIPFFYPLKVHGGLEIASLAGMILALFFYIYVSSLEWQRVMTPLETV